MKNYFIKSCIAFISLQLIGCAAPAPEKKVVSPLQLRMMQTRLFEKPITEILKAAEVAFADKGGQCAVFSSEIQREYQDRVSKNSTDLKMPDVPDSTFQCSSPIGKIKSEKNILDDLSDSIQKKKFNPLSASGDKLSIKGNLKPYSKDEKKTEVRIRIYKNISLDWVQVDDPVEYSKAFNAIADAAFTNAIEIAPGTID